MGSVLLDGGCNALSHIIEQDGRVHVEGDGKIVKLDDIDAPLTPFNIADVALVLANTRCEVGLQYPGTVASLNQRSHDGSVSVREKRFSHAAPAQTGIELHAKTAYAVFAYTVGKWVMSFSNDERRRVEEDERYRIHSREQHALRRDREGSEQAKKDEHRRQFVAHHGRDGAIRHTVRKWMLGAAIVSVLCFFVAIGDEGFLVAAKNALLCFIGWTAIGVVRAFYLVNSAR